MCVGMGLSIRALKPTSGPTPKEEWSAPFASNIKLQ